MIRAYAESTSNGRTVGGGSKLGQNTIARNMTRAGATRRQISNAQRRARQMNAPVTRV